MAQVFFKSENKAFSTPPNTKLCDLVDEKKAQLPFGCRMGSCGTCRVVILAGMENLNPRTKAEELLFSQLTSVHPNERLGCQLTIFGDVTIQV